jgi:hypothetical protein
LERAENDVVISQGLQALRGQYVKDEMIVQRARRAAQVQTYDNAALANFNAAIGPFGNSWALGPFGNAYGFGYAYPGYYYPGAYSGFTPVYTMPGTFGVAYGMGDEGRLKDDMVRMLAAQSSPDYAAAAAQRYQAALARASESDKLRAALGMRERTVVPADYSADNLTRLTLRTGETIEGTFKGEDNDWITLEKGNKEVRVRKSDAMTIARPKSAVKPAATDK